MMGYTERMAIEEIIFERPLKKISRKNLAIKTGLSESMIQKMENGKKSPTLRSFIKILNALNMKMIITH